jgi:hypothetical protein
MKGPLGLPPRMTGMNNFSSAASLADKTVCVVVICRVRLGNEVVGGFFASTAVLVKILVGRWRR